VDRVKARQNPNFARQDAAFLAFVMFASVGPVQLPQVGINAVLGAWLCYRYLQGRPKAHYTVPLIPVLFVVLVLASFWWSHTPGTVLYSGATLVLYLLIALNLATRYSLSELVDGISYGFKWLLIASLIAVVVSPSTALTQAAHEFGSLKGIAYHKNYMGYIASLAAVTFFYQFLTYGRKRGAAFWCVLALAIVFLARSQTAIILTVVWLLVTYILLSQIGRKGGQAIAGILTALVSVSVGLFAILNLEDFLGRFNRDTSLSGRTEIWEAVEYKISQEFWLGYGRESVWGPLDPVGNSIRSILGFSISHAHNGYLNIILEVGIFGLILTVVLLAVCLMRSLRVIASSFTVGVWCLSVVALISCFNMVENRASLNTGWFLLCLIYVATKKILESRDSADRAGFESKPKEEVSNGRG